MKTPFRTGGLAVLLSIVCVFAEGVPPPEAAGAVREVTFETADGVTISADYHPASGQGGPGGVVLLHMLSVKRRSWDPLVPFLKKAGFAVLAVDLRGHGKSVRQAGRDAPLNPGSVLMALDTTCQDAEAAVAFLGKQGIPAEKITLAGAGLGAGAALRAACADKRIPRIVLLSPDASAPRDIAGYGDRPALILSTKSDLPLGASRIKETLSGENVVLETPVPKNAFGTRLLARAPGVCERIVEWLSSAVQGSGKEKSDEGN